MANRERMMEVFEHIKSHPSEWNQAKWHCGTAYCFIGHGAIKAVGKNWGKLTQYNIEKEGREYFELTRAECELISFPTNTLEDIEKHIEAFTTTDKKIIETLSKDDNWIVRYAIAKRAELPKPIIETLSKDDDWVIRFAIANRAELPESIIETLAKDDNWMVRQAIANRAELPESIIETLAKDDDLAVRFAIKKRSKENDNNDNTRSDEQ